MSTIKSSDYKKLLSFFPYVVDFINITEIFNKLGAIDIIGKDSKVIRSKNIDEIVKVTCDIDTTYVGTTSQYIIYKDFDSFKNTSPYYDAFAFHRIDKAAKDPKFLYGDFIQYDKEYLTYSVKTSYGDTNKSYFADPSITPINDLASSEKFHLLDDFNKDIAVMQLKIPFELSCAVIGYPFNINALNNKYIYTPFLTHYTKVDNMKLHFMKLIDIDIYESLASHIKVFLNINFYIFYVWYCKANKLHYVSTNLDLFMGNEYDLKYLYMYTKNSPFENKKSLYYAFKQIRLDMANTFEVNQNIPKISGNVCILAKSENHRRYINLLFYESLDPKLFLKKYLLSFALVDLGRTNPLQMDLTQTDMPWKVHSFMLELISSLKIEKFIKISDDGLHAYIDEVSLEKYGQVLLDCGGIPDQFPTNDTNVSNLIDANIYLSSSKELFGIISYYISNCMRTKNILDMLYLRLKCHGAAKMPSKDMLLCKAGYTNMLNGFDHQDNDFKQDLFDVVISKQKVTPAYYRNILPDYVKQRLTLKEETSNIISAGGPDPPNTIKNQIRKYTVDPMAYITQLAAQCNTIPSSDIAGIKSAMSTAIASLYDGYKDAIYGTEYIIKKAADIFTENGIPIDKRTIKNCIATYAQILKLIIDLTEMLARIQANGSIYSLGRKYTSLGMEPLEEQDQQKLIDTFIDNNASQFDAISNACKNNLNRVLKHMAKKNLPMKIDLSIFDTRQINLLKYPDYDLAVFYQLETIKIMLLRSINIIRDLKMTNSTDIRESLYETYLRLEAYIDSIFIAKPIELPTINNIRDLFSDVKFNYLKDKEIAITKVYSTIENLQSDLTDIILYCRDQLIRVHIMIANAAPYVKDTLLQQNVASKLDAIIDILKQSASPTLDPSTYSKKVANILNPRIRVDDDDDNMTSDDDTASLNPNISQTNTTSSYKEPNLIPRMRKYTDPNYVKPTYETSTKHGETSKVQPRESAYTDTSAYEDTSAYRRPASAYKDISTYIRPEASTSAYGDIPTYEDTSASRRPASVYKDTSKYIRPETSTSAYEDTSTSRRPASAYEDISTYIRPEASTSAYGDTYTSKRPASVYKDTSAYGDTSTSKRPEASTSAYGDTPAYEDTSTSKRPASVYKDTSAYGDTSTYKRPDIDTSVHTTEKRNPGDRAYYFNTDEADSKRYGFLDSKNDKPSETEESVKRTSSESGPHSSTAYFPLSSDIISKSRIIPTDSTRTFIPTTTSDSTTSTIPAPISNEQNTIVQDVLNSTPDYSSNTRLSDGIARLITLRINDGNIYKFNNNIPSALIHTMSRSNNSSMFLSMIDYVINGIQNDRDSYIVKRSNICAIIKSIKPFVDTYISSVKP